MATRIYESKTIKLIDGTLVYLTPLKIKYLREFMDAFEFVKTATNDEQAIFFYQSVQELQCSNTTLKFKRYTT